MTDFKPNKKVKKNKDLNKIKASKVKIIYEDKRIIVSAEGDRSTFDDFDWGEDMSTKTGFGSSYCQRILL